MNIIIIIIRSSRTNSSSGGGGGGGGGGGSGGSGGSVCYLHDDEASVECLHPKGTKPSTWCVSVEEVFCWATLQTREDK
jgi:hypothetical protein